MENHCVHFMAINTRARGSSSSEVCYRVKAEKASGGRTGFHKVLSHEKICVVELLFPVHVSMYQHEIFLDSQYIQMVSTFLMKADNGFP